MAVGKRGVLPNCEGSECGDERAMSKRRD